MQPHLAKLPLTKAGILALLAMSGSSCVSTPMRGWPEGVVIAIDYSDDIQNQRILVTYHNKTNKNICLSYQGWPQEGRVINTSHPEIRIGEQVFPAKFVHGAYPWAPKWKKARKEGRIPFAAPKQSITTFLRYDAFDMPQDYYNAPNKELIAKFRGYPC